MKLTLAFALSCLAFASFGQKVKYLDKNFNRVDFKKDATYYTETTQKNGMALVGTVKTFKMDSTLVSEIEYSSLASKRRDGLAKFYYPNGNLKSEATYKNDLFHGPLKTFYPNLRLKRAELYEKGYLVQAKCFSTTGHDTTFYAYQTDPEFPGGEAALEQYVRTHLKNSSYSKKPEETSAIAYFIVISTGEIVLEKVTTYGYKYKIESIKQMVKDMPRWIPGTDDGLVANKLVLLPISFAK